MLGRVNQTFSIAQWNLTFLFKFNKRHLLAHYAMNIFFIVQLRTFKNWQNNDKKGSFKTIVMEQSQYNMLYYKINVWEKMLSILSPCYIKKLKPFNTSHLSKKETKEALHNHWSSHTSRKSKPNNPSTQKLKKKTIFSNKEHGLFIFHPISAIMPLSNKVRSLAAAGRTFHRNQRKVNETFTRHH